MNDENNYYPFGLGLIKKYNSITVDKECFKGRLIKVYGKLFLNGKMNDEKLEMKLSK